MWKFSELPYARPDMDAIKARYAAETERLAKATSYDEAKAAYLAQDAILSELQTVITIASVRNTMDTKDPFYDAEMTFLNHSMAAFSPLQKQALDALLATPYRKAFEGEYGDTLFVKAALEARTQSEAIVPDLIEQSDLEDQYKKIAASCEVDFHGETCNFYGLLKHMESPDRETRKAAFLAWGRLYESISGELDTIYDRLIAVRLRIAEKLGFQSYTELAYANMGRTDYGPEEVASFRKQVRDVIVPAAKRYREQQAKRIGVDKLRYYDENYMFPDGNADPVGGEDVLVPIATEMYRELSPETGEFFDFMVEHALFDLNTRPGKHLGGYCTSLPEYKAPFIFSNFNGTAADVGVLTHEAGHAFAGYSAARHQPFLAYWHSTSEVAEIHSMTMEHFTYPWTNKLYGDANVKKAKYTHLCDAFSVIPYLVSVDEFQHRVYENPTMTAGERRAVWHEIEQTYLPWRDYDGFDFLAEGGFWMQKQHIFLYPFYYIDYALAQVCAFAFYGRMKEDLGAAWKDYLALCEAGGSRDYFDLLKLANLPNPFEAGSVQQAVRHVIDELDAPDAL